MSIVIQKKEIKEEDFDEEYINFLKLCRERGNGRLAFDDILFLSETCKRFKPKNIVEIGSYDGSSTQIFGKYAKENDAHLWCIEPVIRDLLLENIEVLAIRDSVTIVNKKSPWVDVKEVGLPIDILFIDGNHLTRWCLADYHYWERFVKRGGLILIHDWCGDGSNGTEVRRAIDMILETDELEEYGRTTTRSQGILAFIKKSRYN